jgi:hypothetical protein
MLTDIGQNHQVAKKPKVQWCHAVALSLKSLKALPGTNQATKEPKNQRLSAAQRMNPA